MSMFRVRDFVYSKPTEVISAQALDSLRGLKKPDPKEDRLIGDFMTTVNVQVVRSKTDLEVYLFGTLLGYMGEGYVQDGDEETVVYSIKTANHNEKLFFNLHEAVSYFVYAHMIGSLR